ncbi:hypothetical protein [Bacillus sp. Marseille-P3661]|nr:hypothetical protein [Bacillus sp. Marseille-P3661]
MDEHCFYCNNTIEELYYHGLFKEENDYVDKPLCPDCYREWLIGIKG